jgi:uncharacterized protein YjbI with pentapeptide repeats
MALVAFVASVANGVEYEIGPKANLSRANLTGANLASFSDCTRNR